MITKKEIDSGKIIVHKNFLTHAEAIDFWYLTNTCEWSYGRVSNAYSSQKQSRMTRAFDIDVFVKTDLFIRIDALFKEELQLAKAYINYSDHATVSLPHCDGNEAGPTIMICLNQEWKREWGGYTAVFDHMNSSDVVHTSVPEPGKMTIFKGSLWHTGVPIAHFTDYPRFMLTLHSFLEEKEKK